MLKRLGPIRKILIAVLIVASLGAVSVVLSGSVVTANPCPNGQCR